MKVSAWITVEHYWGGNWDDHQGQSESPHHLSCPWNMSSTCLSRVEAAPRTQLWERKVLRSSGWFMWLNLVKASLETLWFWWAGIEIYSSCGCPRQVVCKFPCLLKLPATSLERSASSGVSPSPLCPRASFRFHLGKLSRWKPQQTCLM